MLSWMNWDPIVEIYRVVLADDQATLRHLIRRILSSEHELEVVGEACDGTALLHLLRDSEELPDMVILDISMPGMCGIEAAREIRTSFPRVKVLVLTVHDESEYISQAFTAGAAGYLLKEDADTELYKAIDVIRQGGTYRSPRIASPAA